MAFIDEHKAKFDNLRASLEIQNRDQLRRKANGGNSIIFIYPPKEEKLYLNKLTEFDDQLNLVQIDIAKLLIEFIDEVSIESIERKYSIFKATPHKVFLPFVQRIIKAIQKVNDEGKSPVLVRTGALYGTGIENVNIMENKVVMGLTHPLIIFYPSKTENGNLYFLNFKPASKYRCTVID
ncbi:hypothetical protein AAGF08_09720 [Algoriphagus sp. SE2]|uniref:hypothetical protein n=1 Tax=Algoriphagus sp. SE2 TaxID=3141536 RepID=UPI0031CD3FC8